MKVGDIKIIGAKEEIRRLKIIIKGLTGTFNSTSLRTGSEFRLGILVEIDKLKLVLKDREEFLEVMEEKMDEFKDKV